MTFTMWCLLASLLIASCTTTDKRYNEGPLRHIYVWTRRSISFKNLQEERSLESRRMSYGASTTMHWRCSFRTRTIVVFLHMVVYGNAENWPEFLSNRLTCVCTRIIHDLRLNAQLYPVNSSKYMLGKHQPNISHMTLNVLFIFLTRHKKIKPIE